MDHATDARTDARTDTRPAQNQRTAMILAAAALSAYLGIYLYYLL